MFLSLLTLFHRLLHSELKVKLTSNSKLWIEIQLKMTLLVKEFSLSVKFSLLLLSMAGYNSSVMKRMQVNFLSGLNFSMIRRPYPAQCINLTQFLDNNIIDLKTSKVSLCLSHFQDLGLLKWNTKEHQKETNSQYQKVMLLVIKHNYKSQCNQGTKRCNQEDHKGSFHHSLRDRGLSHKVFINHLLNINEIKLICINFN